MRGWAEGVCGVLILQKYRRARVYLGGKKALPSPHPPLNGGVGVGMGVVVTLIVHPRHLHVHVCSYSSCLTL